MSRPSVQWIWPPVWRMTMHLTLSEQCSSAASALALSGVVLPPRGAKSAVTTTVASESLIRLESESGEKPAKTTEWIAPIRAQASIV
jgi:hypothetical protein